MQLRDIMMHVEGYHEDCGGYHPLKFEYCGGIL